MSLTRHFRESVLNRAKVDPEFRQALLIEAINEFLADNVEVAKKLLRDYINATIQFETLAKRMHKNSKSIQRMLSENGNPTSNSLFSMLHVLQQSEGIKLIVQRKEG